MRRRRTERRDCRAAEARSRETLSTSTTTFGCSAVARSHAGARSTRSCRRSDRSGDRAPDGLGAGRGSRAATARQAPGEPNEHGARCRRQPSQSHDTLKLPCVSHTPSAHTIQSGHCHSGGHALPLAVTIRKGLLISMLSDTMTQSSAEASPRLVRMREAVCRAMDAVSSNPEEPRTERGARMAAAREAVVAYTRWMRDQVCPR